jgi:IS1 family transposase
LPKISETLLPFKDGDILELDEIWSFVKRKSNQCWTWIGLCRRTRQIVTYVSGNRSKASCMKLKSNIPKDYKHASSVSDYWEAYQIVFTENHKCVGKDSGETNHVERWNNTLRQRVGRFVRKTLSFSKKQEHHKMILDIFIHQYNLDISNHFMTLSA